jgi:hypothetical protein
VVSEDLLLPFQNPMFWVALWLGVLDYDTDALVTDQPFFCGPVGCANELLGVIEVGPVTIVTSPGETFAETLVGREETTIDYGGSWGPFTYPAIEGLEQYMGDAIPMHMALCNDEIGYMVPISDFHEINHPEFYCESDAISYRTVPLYREAVIDLLTQ